MASALPALPPPRSLEPTVIISLVRKLMETQSILGQVLESGYLESRIFCWRMYYETRDEVLDCFSAIEQSIGFLLQK